MAFGGVRGGDVMANDLGTRSRPKDGASGSTPKIDTQQAKRQQCGSVSWQRFWGTLSFMGVVASLGIYGVLQERIMSSAYDGQVWGQSAFLVFCNRLIAFDLALIYAIASRQPLSPQVPVWRFAGVSLLNVTATTCQYEALKWVSFPVQVMGKTMKMLPVMVWGIVMSQQQYPASDWIAAAFVTFGIFIFIATGNISASQADQDSSAYGLLLLLGFLAADSLTSTSQEALLKRKKVCKMNQMLYVNALSAVVSACAVLGGEGLGTAARFCVTHPRFLCDVFVLSTVAMASQVCILSVLQLFGALALAAAMNVRQLLSIVLSCIIYGHRVTPLQAVGLTMAFVGLFGKTFFVGVLPWFRRYFHGKSRTAVADV